MSQGNEQTNSIAQQIFNDAKSPIQAPFLDKPALHSSLETIKNEINEIVYSSKELIKGICNQSPRFASAICNLPQWRNNFIGRYAQLKQLVKAFETNEHLVIADGHNGAALTGLGGIGKTELSIMFAYLQRAFYKDNIRLIHAETQQSLERSFRKLGKKLQLSVDNLTIEKLVSKIYKKLLEDKAVPCLLIFDNAISYMAIKDYLPFKQPKNYHILINSRNQHWRNNDGIEYKPLCLRELTENEAIAFILVELKELEPIQDARILEARELAQSLGMLPLALQQAVAYIAKNRPLTMKEYLTLYESKQKAIELLAEEGQMEPSYRNDNSINKKEGKSTIKIVTTTWNITIDLIKTKFKGKKQEKCSRALEILGMMAYLNFNDIPCSFFEKYFHPVPAPEVKKAIGILIKYSLITHHKEQTVLSIHKLVQEVIRLGPKKLSFAENQSDDEYLLKTIRLLNQQFNYNRNQRETIKDSQPYLPHIPVLMKFIQQQAIKSETVGQLLSKYGQYQLWEKREFTLAEEILLYAAGCFEECHNSPAQKEGLAAVYAALGFAYALRKREDNTEKAELYAQKAEALYQETRPAELSMALVAGLWGVIEQNKSRWSQAQEKLQQSIQIEESLQSLTKTPLYAANHSNLASSLNEQGYYTAALKYALLAVQLHAEVYGTKEHPEAILNLRNLGLIYQQQQLVPEAKAHYQECLSLYEKLYGLPDCYAQLEVLQLTREMIILLCKTKQWDEATKLYETCVSNQQKLSALDKKQEGTYPKLFLALIQSSQQDFASAQKNMQEWLEAQKALLGSLSQPDTQNGILNFTSILNHQNQEAENKRFMQNLEVLGKDEKNDFVLQARLNFEAKDYSQALMFCDKAITQDSPQPIVYSIKGNILYSRSEYKEALDCYGKCLVLQSEVPFLYYWKGNCLQALEKYSDAMLCYEKALVLLAKKFSFEAEEAVMPETAYPTYQLAKCCFKLGYHREAIDYAEQVLALYERLVQNDNPLNLNLSDLLGQSATRSLLLKRPLEIYALRYLNFLKTWVDSKEEKTASERLMQFGDKFGQYRETAIALVYYQAALEKLEPSHTELGARLQHRLGQACQIIGQYPEALAHYAQALSFFTQAAEDRFIFVRLENLGAQAECYSIQKEYVKAEICLQEALALSQAEDIRQLPAFEKAKANLARLCQILGLKELQFDNNNTCILGIDDTFSLHLTYEPNRQLLYVYSPLLDGLPKDNDKRLNLYECLLTGSMLGGQMVGGGVGVAVKEELILMHCTLSMQNAEALTLVEFFPTFINAVEKWRAFCQEISTQEKDARLLIPSSVRSEFRYTQQSLLRALVDCCSRQDKIIEAIKYSKLEDLALQNARANLLTLGQELSLKELQFDNNNTCILGIDDTFSLHLTYEPNRQLLYVYSPLLDGLPKDNDKRLNLYECLLTGSMLGGQMVGGGVGVAVKEELILMHCTLSMQNAAPTALTQFLPLFVAVVEKWRKTCAEIMTLEEIALSSSHEITRPKFTQILQMLNRLTGIPFTGYLRKTEEIILDAVIACNKLEDYMNYRKKLVKLALEFTEKEVSPCIFYLIIPDINRPLKAESIAKQYQQALKTSSLAENLELNSLKRKLDNENENFDLGVSPAKKQKIHSPKTVAFWGPSYEVTLPEESEASFFEDCIQDEQSNCSSNFKEKTFRKRQKREVDEDVCATKKQKLAFKEDQKSDDIVIEGDLEKAKKISQESALNENKIGPRSIPGWDLKDVNDKGNCFYEAASDQLELTQHDFIAQVPQGALIHDSLRLNVQGAAFKDREWAGDKEIQQLCENLNLIIAVVDTRFPERGYTHYFIDENNEEKIITSDYLVFSNIQLPQRPVIKLAYTGNHYLSVRAEPNSQSLVQSNQAMFFAYKQDKNNENLVNKDNGVRKAKIEYSHQVNVMEKELAEIIQGINNGEIIQTAKMDDKIEKLKSNINELKKKESGDFSEINPDLAKFQEEEQKRYNGKK